MQINRIIYFLAFFFSVNAAAQDYKIGVNDVVDISVFQQEDLSVSVRVTENGRIKLPFIGYIIVAGQTVDQAAKVIEKELQSKGIVNSPQVSVDVTEFSGRNASVLGKVHNPGEFSINSGDTIIDVISKAGGLLEDANPSITLYRGESQPRTFNLYSASNSEINQNSAVQSGDVILVAQAEVFYTYGEVNNASEYLLRDNMTVMQALSISGGLTNKASEKGIYIVRNSADGESETHKANLNEIVQPSDVILVKESLF